MAGAKRRVRIDLAYDGTQFAGWQIQRRERTVQGVLRDTLTELHGGEPVVVNGASRTDAGVHARQQVTDCEFDDRLDDDKLLYVLRRRLPDDVRPLRVATVDPGFHSRKLAISKRYHYRLDLTATGDVFATRFAVHQPEAIDETRMRAALERLPGERDWTGFTSARSDKDCHVRELTLARYERNGPDRGQFVFAAGGFLRYMVRNIVGTLLEIGRGRMPVTIVDEILATCDRGLAGPTAPAKGLCLERVTYES